MISINGNVWPANGYVLVQPVPIKQEAGAERQPELRQAVVRRVSRQAMTADMPPSSFREGDVVLIPTTAGYEVMIGDARMLIVGVAQIVATIVLVPGTERNV